MNNGSNNQIEDKNSRTNPQKDQKNTNPNLIYFGSNFAAGVGLLTYIGFKIDDTYLSSPLFTLVGTFLGLLYGFYEMWKLIRNQQ